jgi:superfamily II DNA helicase RecQ
MEWRTIILEIAKRQFVFDEAHCIAPDSRCFRPEFSELGRNAVMPVERGQPGVTRYVALSATLPILQEAFAKQLAVKFDMVSLSI